MKYPLLIDRVLAPGGLRVLFQPIMEWRDGCRLHALESLVRGPTGTNVESAEVLFGYMRRKQAETVVDRACAEVVLAAAAAFQGEVPINFNVHGRTIEQDRLFPQLLADCVAAAGLRPQDLTVEIVEHSATNGSAAFAAGLARLREVGISIAIDDIGLGQSNYRMLLVVRPDYFKLDRFLVQGCARDAYRRAILRSLSDLAESVGALAVAEGIDTLDDLRAVREAGLRLAQGFLLARPQTAEQLGTPSQLRAGLSDVALGPCLSGAA